MAGEKKASTALVNDQVLRMRARGFVKPREVAERAGISLPRIYTLLDEGKLQGENVGTRRYISFASMAAYFGPLVLREGESANAGGPGN
jgi:excisionase family DNA binding protein